MCLLSEKKRKFLLYAALVLLGAGAIYLSVEAHLWLMRYGARWACAAGSR